MKKGFTLMEILFVVLFVALLLTLAAPAFRAVRFDIKNVRAKNALKKMAEARRAFYQFNRGADIALDYVNGGTASQYNAGLACNNVAASGVPGSSTAAQPVGQLFACGFLDWRDFEGLPYSFYICNPNAASPSFPCVADAYVAAKVKTNENAGSKYNASSYNMWVDKQMRLHDAIDGLID